MRTHDRIPSRSGRHASFHRTRMAGLAPLLLSAGPAAADAAQAQVLNALDSFRDCDRCPEMVALEPETFIMGSDCPPPTERPAHRVTLSRPFAIGRFEVTFDEWAACVEETACAEMPDDHNWGRGNRPVINVTFAEAETYAKWLSRKTGTVYHLPTEAEWEYAARGGTQTEFSWGDDVGENNANCRDCKAHGA